MLVVDVAAVAGWHSKDYVCTAEGIHHSTRVIGVLTQSPIRVMGKYQETWSRVVAAARALSDVEISWENGKGVPEGY